MFLLNLVNRHNHGGTAEQASSQGQGQEEAFGRYAYVLFHGSRTRLTQFQAQTRRPSPIQTLESLLKQLRDPTMYVGWLASRRINY